MMLSSVIVLLLVTCFGNCFRLTKEENEYRLESCGRGVKSKIFRGTIIDQSAAPWSVFFNILNKKGTATGICTGTLVSPRHILIATHCVANLDVATRTWSLFESNFDRRNCKEKDYVISDEEFLQRIQILSNNERVATSPEKVTLVNACYQRERIPNGHAQLEMDDLAIIDLHENLVLSDTINTVCVANDTTANAKGTTMNLFGYGMNPESGGDATGILKKETIQVSPDIYYIPEYFFFASDPKNHTVACEGDSGGGAIAVISDRLTIVGTLSQSTCSNVTNKSKPVELYVSVGYYNSKICRLTGICTSDEVNKHQKNYVETS